MVYEDRLQQVAGECDRRFAEMKAVINKLDLRVLDMEQGLTQALASETSTKDAETIESLKLHIEVLNRQTNELKQLEKRTAMANKYLMLTIKERDKFREIDQLRIKNLEAVLMPISNPDESGIIDLEYAKNEIECHLEMREWFFASTEESVNGEPAVTANA